MATRGRLLLATSACIAGVSLAAVFAPAQRVAPLEAPPIGLFERRPTWVPPAPAEPPRMVEVLILGDGYLAEHERARFLSDFTRCSRALLDAEPMVRFKERIRVRSCFVASKETGCDEAADDDLVDTAFDCRFRERGGRGVMVFGTKALFARVREALPVDVVLVMVNTTRHGGAASTLVEASGWRLPIGVVSATDRGLTQSVVHEFGHCFAGLADEYSEEAVREEINLRGCTSDDLRAPNVMLWREVDERSHESIAATATWGHFLALPGAREHAWLHRGGFYHQTGVVRPWPRCRMKQSSEDAFCPVCDEQVAKRIVATLGEEWNDAEWHLQRPLSDWK